MFLSKHRYGAQGREKNQFQPAGAGQWESWPLFVLFTWFGKEALPGNVQLRARQLPPWPWQLMTPTFFSSGALGVWGGRGQWVLQGVGSSIKFTALGCLEEAGSLEGPGPGGVS